MPARLRLPRLSLALSVALLAASGAHALPSPPASPDTPIRVGVMAFTDATGYTTYVNQDDAVIERFGEILARAAPDLRFEIQVMRTKELVEAARAGKIDIVYGSSGCFSQLLPEGIFPLATLTTARAPDPNQAVAGALIVRIDRDDLQHLEDLKGRRAIGGLSEMFFNYQLPISAVADAGHDPERFFASLRQVDRPVGKTLDAVLSGTADAGLIRACVLEELPDSLRSQFRVVDPVENSPLHCAHTSRLFPNWTVGAMPGVPSEVAKKITVGLLSAKPQGEIGIGWSLANNFASIDALYRTLKFGRYAYLKEWTVSRLWRAAWPFLLAAFTGLLVFVYSFFRIRRLVEKRTESLQAEIARRQALEKERSLLSQKFCQMEKAGTMGQLSNMVAHEMRQPLAALHARLHTIGMVVKREEITSPVIARTLEGSERDVDRMDAIVEHICAYCREGRKDEAVDLNAIVREVVEEMRRMALPVLPVKVQESANLTVRGDPLELKLIVYNLLKNALEAEAESWAMSDTPPDAVAPAPITARLSKEMGEARLEILDEATEISEERLAAIRAGHFTTKKNGLGLGLALVCEIVTSHAGTIVFEKNEPRGLRVTVTLPALLSDQPPVPTSTQTPTSRPARASKSEGTLR